jgi:hypothetical protein
MVTLAVVFFYRVALHRAPHPMITTTPVVYDGTQFTQEISYPHQGRIRREQFCEWDETRLTTIVSHRLREITAEQKGAHCAGGIADGNVLINTHRREHER